MFSFSSNQKVSQKRYNNYFYKKLAKKASACANNHSALEASVL